ncbi:MAG: septation protein SpoVG family protein [Desulfobacteraceae bacterium]|nr:septation protein SpoVG family protein [Desulfobacteraceae bacterium]
MVEVSRIYRVDDPTLKAFADVAFGQVLVKSVRLIKNRDGEYFVKMPSQQAKNGKWYDTVMLLDEALKDELLETITEAYHV